MSLSTNTDGIINAVLGGLQGPAGPAGPAGPPGVSTGQVLFPFPTATGGPNPAPNDGAINLTISNTSESTINTTFTQNVPVRIGSFTTAANYPNVTTLLPDLWDLNVYATASAATGVYAFFNLYEVQTDNGNLEVLIAGLNTSPYTGGGVLISGTPSSSVQFYSYSLNVPTYAMYSANSLLRVKLYAVDTLATGRSATFYFGSTSASPYPTHIHSGLVAQGSGGVTINNPAQYRILTDTNASTINGEANLTFNGSTLSVAGTGGLSVTNGTTLSSTLNVLGSTSLTSLQATGNTYLATAGGYVGIGNTNTTYNLDVTGTARVSGNTLVGGTLGVTGATTLAGLSAGATTVSTLSTSGLATLASASVTGNETVGGTLNVTGATTLAGASTLSSASISGNETVGGTLNVTGATTLSTLSSSSTTSLATGSGIVTIGSAPPSQVYKFDINNGASTNMAQRIYGSSVDGALIRYENVASGGTIYHTGSTAPGSGAGAGFAIYDVTNSASRFLVSGVSGTLGYIGIGNSAPSYLLDVAGSINATNDSYFKTNVGSVFFIPLGTETGTNTTFIRNDGTYTYLMCGSRAGYNSLRPFTVTNSNGLVSMQQGLNIYGGCGINGGSTIDALNVTGNTNLATTSGSSVGIGTTTPSYLLDVAGKIRGAVPYNLLSPGAGTTTLTISNQNTYYYVTPSASGAIIALPAANTSGYMDGGFFTFRIPSTASYGATINGVVVATGTTITFINLYIGGAPTWSQF